MKVKIKKMQEDAPEAVATKLDVRKVDINLLMPNDYNPNVMSEDKFDLLSEDIETEDMDQPIVVRWDEATGKYVIIDGEHRYRASVRAGLSEILVSVKDWDAKQAKLQTVRRNLLRGDLDVGKFSSLVRVVEHEQDLDVNDVRKAMGFTSEKEFARFYKDEAVLVDAAISKIKDDVDLESKDMTMVSEMVRAIMIKYGDALRSGTICFVHNKSVVLGISVTNEQAHLLQSIADLIRDLKLTKTALAGKVDAAMLGLKASLEDSM